MCLTCRFPLSIVIAIFSSDNNVCYILACCLLLEPWYIDCLLWRRRPPASGSHCAVWRHGDVSVCDAVIGWSFQYLYCSPVITSYLCMDWLCNSSRCQATRHFARFLCAMIVSLCTGWAKNEATAWRYVWLLPTAWINLRDFLAHFNAVLFWKHLLTLTSWNL